MVYTEGAAKSCINTVATVDNCTGKVGYIEAGYIGGKGDNLDFIKSVLCEGTVLIPMACVNTFRLVADCKSYGRTDLRRQIQGRSLKLLS